MTRRPRRRVEVCEAEAKDARRPPIDAWPVNSIDLREPHFAGQGQRRHVAGYIIREVSLGDFIMIEPGFGAAPFWVCRVEGIRFRAGHVIQLLVRFLESPQTLGERFKMSEAAGKELLNSLLTRAPVLRKWGGKEFNVNKQWNGECLPNELYLTDEVVEITEKHFMGKAAVLSQASFFSMYPWEGWVPTNTWFCRRKIFFWRFSRNTCD